MSDSELVLNDTADRTEFIPVCVILARKEIQSTWSDHVWEPISVVLDAPKGVHGKVRQVGDSWTQYFMECDPLELHRKDAPAYQEGLLQNDKGCLWVVLAEEEDNQNSLPYYVQLVTASPYEAQDYLDSGELLVETVDMPELLRLHIEEYIAKCPEEEKFIKRKQKKKFTIDHNFGQQSLHEIRRLEKKGISS
jgi:hypothetical protein